MQSTATTPEAYIAEMPEDRQAAFKKLRAVIKKNLPKGFKETIAYGHIGYRACFTEKFYCCLSYGCICKSCIVKMVYD